MNIYDAVLIFILGFVLGISALSGIFYRNKQPEDYDIKIYEPTNIKEKKDVKRH